MLTHEEFEIMNNAPSNATHFISNIKSGVTAYAVKSDDGIFKKCDDSGWFLMHAWNVDECIADLRKQHEEDLKIIASVWFLRADSERFSLLYGASLCKFNLCIREMSDHAGVDAFVEYLKQLEQRDFTEKVKEIFKPKQLNIPWEFIEDSVKCVAMDEDEYIHFYSATPLIDGDKWILCASSGDTFSEGVLKIDTDGINWKESLTMCPSK